MIRTYVTRGGAKWNITNFEVKHDDHKTCRYIWQDADSHEEYGFPSGLNKRYIKYHKGRIAFTQEGTFYLG